MHREYLTNIKVIGIGSSGGNVINEMIKDNIEGIEYVTISTDEQDIEKSLANTKIKVEDNLEKSLDDIKTLLKETDILFVTFGMGGSKGVKIASKIGDIAKEMEVLIVGIVTKPFYSAENVKECEEEIKLLTNSMDTLITISSDKLVELQEETLTLEKFYVEANNAIKKGILCFIKLILQNGLVGLDFADIRETLLDSGIAMMGFGEAEGENRVVEATELALQSPLLEKSIKSAQKLILSIAGSSKLGLGEVYTITNMVKEASGRVDCLMFGVTTDDNLGDKLKVIILATNF